MKNGLINKKYINVIILAIYIIVVILISLMYLDEKNNQIDVVLNGNLLNLEKGIVKIKGTRYITREDIEENFASHVFYDKISRTLIITTWDEKVKIKKGDVGTIEYDEETVYSLKMLAEKLGYNYIEDTKTNNIYIYSYEEQAVELKKDRTEVYSLDNDSVIGIVDKKTNIILLETENVYENSIDKYVIVKIVLNNGKIYLAKISKDGIKYTKKVKDVGLVKEDKVTMLCVKNKLGSATDLTNINAVSVDMLKLSASNKIELKKYTLADIKNKDIYAVIDNGYELTGFDTNIITDLVNSDKNKENLATELIDFVMNNNLSGIVIDFKKFKVTDKDLLEQYIKELAVLMHSNNKKIIVKMLSSGTYDVRDIKDFVDYIIVQAYSARTTASKVSGPHSSIPYVKDMLTAFLKEGIGKEKIILEIPTYSILWVERNGTIISSEKYTMQATNEYIKNNDVKVVYNAVSGQNYATYTKGLITYKMWLEDKESIGTKIDIAKEKKIGGISIYKSGEETKDVYDIIKQRWMYE